MSATITPVVRFAFPPSSQEGAAAARPCLAAHMWSATTATALSIFSTSRTPGTAFAFASSTAFSRPPITGEAATAATRTPWGRASMPKSALPLTLSAPSSRCTGRPMRRNSPGFLSATPCGTGSLAASSTSSP